MFVGHRPHMLQGRAPIRLFAVLQPHLPSQVIKRGNEKSPNEKSPIHGGFNRNVPSGKLTVCY